MTKLDKEIQEGLYDPKRTLIISKDKPIYFKEKGQKAKEWGKELRAKAHEGKKLKGQQKLTSAVSTSKRLSEFGYDPKQKKISEKRSMILYSQIKNAEEAIELVKKGEHAGYTLKDLPMLENRLAKRKAEYDNSYTVVKGYDPKKIKTPRDEAWAYAKKLGDTPEGVWARTYLNWFEGSYPHEPDYASMGLGIADKKEVFDHIGGYLRTGAGFKKQSMQRTFDIKGIADSLRRQGIEPDLVDIEAEYDHNLSHSENLKHIKDLLGLGGRRKQGEYEAMAEQFYKAHTMGTGRLAYASPEERAAAFARMREQGTLRGYDPKKPAEIYITTDSKGNKHKVAYAEWLKWMKEQTKRHYDPKRKTKTYSGSIPARWYEAMVKGIKKSSDVRNPYAIVKSIWAKLSPKAKAMIRARETKGERFRYDLPLPIDKPTKGTGTVRMVKPFKLTEVQVNLSVKDYLTALQSGLFSRMKRQDGTTALVARCRSPEKNANIFIDKVK